MEKYWNLVQTLLEKGAFPNQKDGQSRFPLELAIDISEENNMFTVKKNIIRDLLKYKADPNAIDYDGMPILTKAIENGTSVELIKRILDAGGNVNTLYYGESLLITAINKNREDVVKVLLERGADRTIVDPSSKKTPVQIAQELNLPGIVTLLNTSPSTITKGGSLQDQFYYRKYLKYLQKYNDLKNTTTLKIQRP